MAPHKTAVLQQTASGKIRMVIPRPPWSLRENRMPILPPPISLAAPKGIAAGVPLIEDRPKRAASDDRCRFFYQKPIDDSRGKDSCPLSEKAFLRMDNIAQEALHGAA